MQVWHPNDACIGEGCTHRAIPKNRVYCTAHAPQTWCFLLLRTNHAGTLFATHALSMLKMFVQTIPQPKEKLKFCAFVLQGSICRFCAVLKFWTKSNNTSFMGQGACHAFLRILNTWQAAVVHFSVLFILLLHKRKQVPRNSYRKCLVVRE